MWQGQICPEGYTACVKHQNVLQDVLVQKHQYLVLQAAFALGKNKSVVG